MKGWALAALALAGAALAVSASTQTRVEELAPLHVRFSRPTGWTLNGDFADRGWATLSYRADGGSASIDVLFHPKDSRLGRRDGFLETLRRLRPGQAQKIRGTRLGGRPAWTVTCDFEGTRRAYSTRAERSPLRETYVLLEQPEGLVVLRLESPLNEHRRFQTALRRLAASLQPYP